MAQEHFNLGLADNDGTGDTVREAFAKMNANFGQIPSGAASGDITVQLNASMSTAEIQAAIDAQPKNLNGKVLTFQFANGTYNLTATLTFSHFFAGVLVVTGNVADTAISQTKSVVLNGPAGQRVIFFNRCLNLRLNYIKTVLGVTAASAAAVFIFDSRYAALNYCALTNANTSSAAGSGYGGVFRESTGIIFNCSVAHLDVAYHIYRSSLTSIDSTSANNSRYGLFSEAGIVFRQGSQPGGSVAATLVINGGRIY
jgi:hypothetical protein